eukprot:12425908-Karenia_brevis.AAC.1
MLQIMDGLLALFLAPLLTQILTPHPATFIGARPHTQPLDVAFSLCQVIEKGLDSHSNACIMQSDISTYFDVLPWCRMADWMAKHDIPEWLIVGLLRVQLVPNVMMYAGGQLVSTIKSRTIGGLTGSRG